MVYKFNTRLLYLFFFITCLHASEPALRKKVAEEHLIVRVLLEEKQVCPGAGWSIGASDGAIITDPRDAAMCIGCSAQKINLCMQDGYLHLNGKKYWRSHVCITPRAGYLMLDGKQYPGAFEIVKQRKKLFLINCVELDHYVASVLKTESWPGWPLEVNKVFAIVSRSYALARIFEGYNEKKPYHICNTNKHQTYSGQQGSGVLMQAVKETKDVFLSHDDKPIIAMFDICCGGVVPKHINSDIDFKKAPYLARSYACTFCKSCKSFTWDAEFSIEHVGQVLSAHVGPVKEITGARVNKTDKAGTVQEVLFKSWRRALTLTGRKLYSLFKDIKSFCFSVKKKGKNVVFSGKGFGHHLGLCQWGARNMVANGWDYKRILKFYYPKTKFAKFKLTKKEESA